ncbi:MAG: outer membrane protein assembly factor BamD [Rhodospirillales bacterium]|nr:outer membrane protein assembly factor BamD [Rhodospirillales bacterium]
MRLSFLCPLIPVFIVLTLGACASAPKKEPEKPVEVLYNEAADALDKKDYVEATRLFDEVERQHPYSKWATKAQQMAAFSSYQDGRYDEAIVALDRFIELHPGNEGIDYAWYLKALCYYDQIGDVRRDQEVTRQALDALTALTSRFPDSQYARDANLKKDLVLDHLAGQEMAIGRYYQKQGAVNAALNRFRSVVTDYQTTAQVPEALHRLVEIYLSLGLKDEATRVAAVLGYNYPGSKWYQDTYALMDPAQRARLADGSSWVDRTIKSLLRPDSGPARTP